MGACYSREKINLMSASQGKKGMESHECYTKGTRNLMSAPQWQNDFTPVLHKDNKIPKELRKYI